MTMPTPRESIQTLGQIAQDYSATLSPSAQKFFVPGAQEAINAALAALDELDAARKEITALNVAADITNAAPKAE
jgi:hypothetical protein